MKTRTEQIDHTVTEQVKKAFYLFQVFLVGLAFPILFFIGVHTQQDNSENSSKFESARTYTMPYDNATVIRI